MSEYETMREDTVKAVLKFEDRRSLSSLNHLLEDSARVSQTIAFLSEITLQTGGENFAEAMTDDATEGLGWILQSCYQALEILEVVRSQKDRIKEVT